MARGLPVLQMGFEPVPVRALREMLGPTGLVYKLTTLIAPIGYGKSVTMKLAFLALQKAGKYCIWYTFDGAHADLDGLLQAISSQLGHFPQVDQGIGAILRTGTPSGGQIEAVADLLRSNPVPVAIFIDNVDCCRDGRLAQLLETLCFETGRRMQLVLSSTDVVPIDLMRARLEGLLLAIGVAELGFDSAGLGAVFGADLAAKLGSDGLAKVLALTEGWPAAIRMVKIILDRARDLQAQLTELTGAHQFIADMFNRAVLSGCGGDLMQFMLMLGLLPRFSARLCAFVGEDADGPRLLDHLLTHNMLIVPLDDHGEWYRFHGLLGGFLAKEAERLLPDDQRRAMLARASRWCEQQGYWREAIDYALRCGQSAEASLMLDRYVEEPLRQHGETARLIAWVDVLRAQGVTLSARTAYWHAWSLALRRSYGQARRQVIALERRQEGGSKLQRDLHLLHAVIDSLSDRDGDARAGAVKWLAGQGADDEPFEVSAAHCIIAAAHLTDGALAEAARAIQLARAAAFDSGSAYVDGWVSTYAGLIAIAEGNFGNGYAGLVDAMHRLRSQLAGETNIASALALVASKCALEMGLEDEARDLLEQGIVSARAHGFIGVAACGLHTAVGLWDGGASGPYSRAGLQDIVNVYPPRLARMLGHFCVARLIELGLVDAARQEAEAMGLWDGTDRDGLADLSRAGLCVALGQYDQGAREIAESLPRARQQRQVGQVIRLTVLLAQIAHGRQQSDKASAGLVEAIRLAARRRIVRPFLYAPALFDGTLDVRPSSFAIEEDRQFYGYLVERLSMAHAPSVMEQSAPFEGLTMREREILTLAAVGLTNAQIAVRLDAGVTTVKWHFRNVFEKMAVHNRASAIAQARHLKLIV